MITVCCENGCGLHMSNAYKQIWDLVNYWLHMNTEEA